MRSIIIAALAVACAFGQTNKVFNGDLHILGDLTVDGTSPSGGSSQSGAVARTSDTRLTISSAIWSFPGAQDKFSASAVLIDGTGAGNARIQVCSDGEVKVSTTGTLALTLAATSGTVTDAGAQTSFLPFCLPLSTWNMTGGVWGASATEDERTLLQGPLHFGDSNTLTCAFTGAVLNCEVNSATVQTVANTRSGATVRCVSSTGSDTYVGTMSPVATSYTDGMVIEFEATATSNTGAATLDCGAGAIAIKKADGSTDPSNNDITSGRQVALRYDGTVFRLPAASSSSGITSLTITRPYTFIAAGNQANATSPTTTDGWSVASTGGAVPGTPGTAPFRTSVLDYADAADLSAILAWRLPAAWNGGDISLTIHSMSGTGTTLGQIAVAKAYTSCPSAGEDAGSAPSFNAAQTANITAASSTVNTVNADVVISALTMTGCVAGEIMYIRLERTGTDGSDNHAGALRVRGVTLNVPETYTVTGS
jgi:hypothetical protein